MLVHLSCDVGPIVLVLRLISPGFIPSVFLYLKTTKYLKQDENTELGIAMWLQIVNIIAADNGFDVARSISTCHM